MPDDNSNALLGAIVGLLVIAVVGMGSFLFLGQKPAPTMPANNTSLADHPQAQPLRNP